MRSVWNGRISFGLVGIPVKLYSAVNRRATSFKLLCKECMTPVYYERRCEGCRGSVDWEDTIKALPLGDGQYLPFSKEELKAIKPENSDRIEVVEFVDTGDIEPVYYDKFYFCAPAQKDERSYFLFRRVLEDSGKAAIGRFVMRDREHVAAIQPYRAGLVLATLNYSYEIRDIEDIDLLAERPELRPEELDLAGRLVAQLTHEAFELDRFTDEFAERLRQMVDRREKLAARERQEAKAFDEDSLLEALQASLN